MKLMIAAALAVFAVPAMAQDTPPPPTDTPAPTVGGYEPANPPPTPPPGAVVQFQPSIPPSQAFPPPPPLEKYPVCKKGQYDKCIERGSRK